jgi:hypothetical protein
MVIIQKEIERLQSLYTGVFGESISADKAFIYVSLLHFCFSSNAVSVLDLKECITDGPNDGGIDFVFYDEEQNKVILGQAKYTGTLDNNSIIEELNKMNNTVKSFQVGNTGVYNENVKRELQNALDRLPENDSGNVEYTIFSTAEINTQSIQDKIENGEYSYSKDMVTTYDIDDISEKIQRSWENLDTVQEAAVLIDVANNYLKYNSESTQGIMVNIAASSVRTLYNKFVDKGLLNLNIRRFVHNKRVDKGINDTLNGDRNNFWFYNNGITIACREFDVDGNKVKLYDFSIVNGGQTTTLIGKYRGSNTQEFYIPCKIISTNKKNDIAYFNKIAEATNSQKPILARDLKSNTPEMRNLQGLLERYDVYLEIKRGEKKQRKTYKYDIKNDELGQLILSFVFQQPGTARAGKKSIFENDSIYNKIYRVNYAKDKDKTDFLVSIVELNDRYEQLETKIKLEEPLDNTEQDILKNGKQIIFAIMGVLYRLANKDIDKGSLITDIDLVRSKDFSYGTIIGNYLGDDLDSMLRKMIIHIVSVLSDGYRVSLNSGESTSVSNYFKTDNKYIDSVLSNFAKTYYRQSIGDDLRKASEVFLR